MAEHSKIEWTEATLNPTVGCTHISEGCDNCYAARFASGRLARQPLYSGLAADGRFTGEVRLVPERLAAALRWRKPRMIFVNSMSDLFHEQVPNEFIASVFATMARAPQHVFQVLTKRHGRMHSLVTGDLYDLVVAQLANDDDLGRWKVATDVPWPLPNVWLGVSVESQKWADIRVPALCRTPAAVRFLSCEPLLAPVDLHRPIVLVDRPMRGRVSALHHFINWVIVGGESGPRARTMDLRWAESLVEQCKSANVPVFVKQLGTAWARWQPDVDRNGADWHLWPEHLRVREYPEVDHG